MTATATAATVQEFLAATPDQRAELAPSLVHGVGAAQLEAVLTGMTDRIGPVVSVIPDGDWYVIVGEHGRSVARVQLDAEGRLAGLWLRPLSRPTLRDRIPARAMLIGGAWLFAAIAVVNVVAAWRAVSVAAWTSNLAGSVFLVVGYAGFSVLPSQFARRWRRLGWGVVAVALALSAVRLGGLPSGSWGATAVSWIITGAAVVVLLVSRRSKPRDAISAPLLFPLPEGEWYVVQGGGRLLNHHWRVAPDRGAVDLTRLRPDGRRAAGLAPTSLEAYAASGSPVVAPCDGTVHSIENDLPEHVPLQPPRVVPPPPPGNHVAIDTGAELIYLCHLQPGSVAVRAGDRVTPGQPVGRVGNSGNTTEPHLHLHAERDGVGLQLRFHQLEQALYRGRRVRQSVR